MIDKKIRSLVSALNSHGIPTTGSCEGHIKYGSPAPWVKITPRGKTTISKAEKQMMSKISQYLKEFYKTRKVPRDVRLVIEKARSGFWVHNGGNSYKHWRALVNKNVERIQEGKKAKTTVDKKEQMHRARTLPTYQKELDAFAAFLRFDSK